MKWALIIKALTRVANNFEVVIKNTLGTYSSSGAFEKTKLGIWVSQKVSHAAHQVKLHLVRLLIWESIGTPWLLF